MRDHHRENERKRRLGEFAARILVGLDAFVGIAVLLIIIAVLVVLLT